MGRSAGAATLASVTDGGCALLPAAGWGWGSCMRRQAQRRGTDAAGAEQRVNARHARKRVVVEWTGGTDRKVRV